VPAAEFTTALLDEVAARTVPEAAGDAGAA
jgi:hypothetical protein